MFQQSSSEHLNLIDNLWFAVDLISDVPLQHHVAVTRKCLNGIIQEFKSKGFTILAVINPQMQTSVEVQAILSLFDGQIRIFEKEKEKDRRKFSKS